jgi:hypothetical protein
MTAGNGNVLLMGILFLFVSLLSDPAHAQTPDPKLIDRRPAVEQDFH